jgi:sec-independent protein translocase protein TatA
MIGDLFDSPWKILIVAVVIIVMFGSRKLPGAARSLGQSMRILKREMQGLQEDEPAVPASANFQAAAPADFQAAAPAEIYTAPVAPAPVGPAPVTPAQAVAAPSAPNPAGTPDAQAQIAALQEQLNSLKQAVSANGATATDGQQTR